MGDDDREEFCVSNWGVILPLRLIHKDIWKVVLKGASFLKAYVFHSLNSLPLSFLIPYRNFLVYYFSTVCPLHLRVARPLVPFL